MKKVPRHPDDVVWDSRGLVDPAKSAGKEELCRFLNNGDMLSDCNWKDAEGVGTTSVPIRGLPNMSRTW